MYLLSKLFSNMFIPGYTTYMPSKIEKLGIENMKFGPRFWPWMWAFLVEDNVLVDIDIVNLYKGLAGSNENKGSSA